MVFCEVCKINTPNMKSHTKSQKHQNGGIRKAMNEEELKDYHKKYYVDKNLKDKYKEKKNCDICNKMVAKYNWSKHIQTEKHFKKEHQKNNPQEPYLRDRLLGQSEEEIIDPLTVKREDLIDVDTSNESIKSIYLDSDSDDEVGEVMKEVLEIESMPTKTKDTKPTKKSKNKK